MKVRLGVIDQYDLQLVEYEKLHQRAMLDLEFKVDGEFEEFNPNWIYLKAIKWEEDMSYDFSKPDSVNTQVIKVDSRNEKVKDLNKRLSEMLEIPEEYLIIMLRRDHGYNSKITAEYYNMEWRNEKIVSDVSKFEHGQILFCEFGEHGADNYKNYKWKAEFERESERITVSINDVMNDPEGMEYRIKISLACSQTLLQFKEKIAQRF